MLECYKDIDNKKKQNEGNQAVLDKLTTLKGVELSPSYQKLISYIEKQYKCSGICRPAFFYLSLPLTEGIPTKPCLPSLNKNIGEELLYLGIIL